MPKSADEIRKMKGVEPIAMLTCYDYPTALALDTCGLDIIFVGDTLGEVVLGFPNTTYVTMEMMLHHLGAVRRGVRQAHLLADMPFRSYDEPAAARRNAERLIDAGADSVKLEGPAYEAVRAIRQAGIEAMGHVGLTPQTDQDYRKKGTDEASAERILREATTLAELGCYAVVVEAVPARLAERITRSIPIPTIGIAAGPACDGQVLVSTDLLGLFEKQPPFVTKRADLRGQIIRAAKGFVESVKGSAPTKRTQG